MNITISPEITEETIKYAKYKNAYTKLMAACKQEDENFDASLFTTYMMGSKRNSISPPPLTYITYHNHRSTDTHGKVFYYNKWIDFEISCWFMMDHAHLTMEQKLLKLILRCKKKYLEDTEKEKKEELIGNLMWMLKYKIHSILKPKKIVYFIYPMKNKHFINISKDRKKEIADHFKNLIDHRFLNSIPIYYPSGVSMFPWGWKK
jgi:hypothetical protein